MPINRLTKMGGYDRIIAEHTMVETRCVLCQAGENSGLPLAKPEETRPDRSAGLAHKVCPFGKPIVGIPQPVATEPQKEMTRMNRLNVRTSTNYFYHSMSTNKNSGASGS